MPADAFVSPAAASLCNCLAFCSNGLAANRYSEASENVAKAKMCLASLLTDAGIFDRIVAERLMITMKLDR